MSYRGREIESKWRVLGGRSLEQVNSRIHAVLGSSVRAKIYGNSTDQYWALPDPEVRGDFIRFRDLGQRRSQITVKGKDRETNENRLEIDVDTKSPKQDVRRLLQCALGSPHGKVTKEYYVYWPGSDQHTNISCYSITEPAEAAGTIFLEIETTSVEELRILEDQMIVGFLNCDIELVREAKSLFELYVQEEK